MEMQMWSKSKCVYGIYFVKAMCFCSFHIHYFMLFISFILHSVGFFCSFLLFFSPFQLNFCENSTENAPRSIEGIGGKQHRYIFKAIMHRSGLIKNSWEKFFLSDFNCKSILRVCCVFCSGGGVGGSSVHILSLIRSDMSMFSFILFIKRRSFNGSGQSVQTNSIILLI